MCISHTHTHCPLSVEFRSAGRCFLCWSLSWPEIKLPTTLYEGCQVYVPTFLPRLRRAAATQRGFPLENRTAPRKRAPHTHHIRPLPLGQTGRPTGGILISRLLYLCARSSAGSAQTDKEPTWLRLNLALWRAKALLAWQASDRRTILASYLNQHRRGLSVIQHMLAHNGCLAPADSCSVAPGSNGTLAARSSSTTCSLEVE